MKAEHKLARQRLSVLELAEALDNVSEACRRRGISRTQFYEYKRRFQTHGIEGLKDLPPVHKSHPMTTPREVQEKIVTLSLSRPGWGCNRVSDQLKKLEGISVSAPTVQNILNKEGLGTRYERWLKLEEKTAQKEIELSAEQVAFILRSKTPALGRDMSSPAGPGSSLTRTSSSWGTLKGWARSTCTRWWTPTRATPLASCTSLSSRRPRWPFCTTRRYRSTPRGAWRSRACSPTTVGSSAGARVIPTGST